jgi:hypothetical protein
MKPVVWTACLDCGQRVTSDSIHTCSPQLKTLTENTECQYCKKGTREMSNYQCPSCGGICKKSRCERADVSAKTLTDEEIKDIWMKRPVGKAEDIFIFARAILRKAQE